VSEAPLAGRLHGGGAGASFGQLQAALLFPGARPGPGKVHLKLLLSLIRQKASMRISLAFCLLAAPASALLATRPVPSQPTQRARLPRMQEAADFEKLRFENLKLKKEVRNIPSR
jgi:hypothetical protein